MSNLNAVIVEGEAERAIMDLLLDNDKLIFTREEILEDKVLKTRNAKSFCEKHLNFSFDGKINVYRILDSKNENFNVPKLYKSKIEDVNVITRPEIEILVIIKEGLYTKYKKSQQKPSKYAAINIKGFEKSYDFYITYFHDVNELVATIDEYQRITRLEKNEKCLNSIIK